MGITIKFIFELDTAHSREKKSIVTNSRNGISS